MRSENIKQQCWRFPVVRSCPSISIYQNSSAYKRFLLWVRRVRTAVVKLHFHEGKNRSTILRMYGQILLESRPPHHAIHKQHTVHTYIPTYLHTTFQFFSSAYVAFVCEAYAFLQFVHRHNAVGSRFPTLSYIVHI